jgi:hypothetical protein
MSTCCPTSDSTDSKAQEQSLSRSDLFGSHTYADYAVLRTTWRMLLDDSCRGMHPLVPNAGYDEDETVKNWFCCRQCSHSFQRPQSRQAFLMWLCFSGFFLYQHGFDRSLKHANAPGAIDVSEPVPRLTHLVVNFYHLARVADPGNEVEMHREQMQNCGWDIHGRVYISTQGINAQFSGLRAHAEAYAAWVAARPFFESMTWRTYPVHGHMFPRLKLKFRENLISLHGGMTSLPVTGVQIAHYL